MPRELRLRAIFRSHALDTRLNQRRPERSFRALRVTLAAVPRRRLAALAEQTTGPPSCTSRVAWKQVPVGYRIKMINSTSAIARQAVRRFTTSAVRRSGHDPYDGVPGHVSDEFAFDCITRPRDTRQPPGHHV